MNDLTPDKIHEEVKEKYGRIADDFKLEAAASVTPFASSINCA